MKKEEGIFWAYFAPDGNVQVRSIAMTRKMSREMICQREYSINDEKITYKDYEKAGYKVSKIRLQITPIEN